MVAPLITAALIGGGASLLGAHMQNRAQASAAQDQMAFQERSVDKQIEFQREMADTAIRRQVKDAMAAGINPMLVARLGGAATPAGASAQGAMPVFQNVGAAGAHGFSEVASAGAAAQQAETQEKLVDSNVQEIAQRIKNLTTDEERIKETIWMLHEQGKLMREQGFTQQIQQYVLEQTMLKLTEETKLVKLDVQAAEFLNNIGRTSEQLRPIVQMMLQLMRSSR